LNEREQRLMPQHGQFTWIAFESQSRNRITIATVTFLIPNSSSQ
jgi:hypothetical protein